MLRVPGTKISESNGCRRHFHTSMAIRESNLLNRRLSEAFIFSSGLSINSNTFSRLLAQNFRYWPLQRQIPSHRQCNTKTSPRGSPPTSGSTPLPCQLHHVSKPKFRRNKPGIRTKEFEPFLPQYCTISILSAAMLARYSFALGL